MLGIGREILLVGEDPSDVRAIGICRDPACAAASSMAAPFRKPDAAHLSQTLCAYEVYSMIARRQLLFLHRRAIRRSFISSPCSPSGRRATRS